jgi:hypothetical protein
VSGRVEGLVQTLHDVTDKPVAVGFGVSKPEHVQQIVQWGAEGVIVGSALVRALGEAPSPVGAVCACCTATVFAFALPQHVWNGERCADWCGCVDLQHAECAEPVLQIPDHSAERRRAYSTC